MTNTKQNTQDAQVPQTRRDDIRGKIFSGSRIESEILDVFGTQIELRPPTLGALMDAQDAKDTKTSVALMIIRYSYVPDTSIQVFEEADIDSVLDLRFGEDLRKMQAAITRLSGVDMEQAKKDIESPLEETS